MQVARWRLVLVGGAVAAIAGAASAQAATYDVGAGPPLKKAPAGVPETISGNQFFPETLKIHVGDKVAFGVYGFHTITFLGGKSRPSLATVGTGTVSGANDAAGNPFWFNGQPLFAFSSVVGAPTPQKSIASRRDFRNSGLPNGPPKPYTLKFTKAGSFKFLCLVHPTAMRGTIKVLKRGKRVLSKRKVAAAVKKQVAAGLKEARKFDKTKGPSGNVIDAGEGKRDGIADNEFFPANKTIPAGTTLHFQVGANTEEPHTATFGPEAFLTPLADSSFSGTPTDPTPYPSDPPGQLAVSSTVHGNGFVNTGWLDRDPKTAQPSSFDVKFPTPGSYYYLCLVHGPSMSGTITVTG